MKWLESSLVFGVCCFFIALYHDDGVVTAMMTPINFRRTTFQTADTIISSLSSQQERHPRYSFIMIGSSSSSCTSSFSDLGTSLSMAKNKRYNDNAQHCDEGDTKHQDTEKNQPQSYFLSFEDSVNERIRNAEKNHNYNKLNLLKDELPEHDYPFNQMNIVVNMSTLCSALTSTHNVVCSNRNTMVTKDDIVTLMKQNGGCLIVQLDNHHDDKDNDNYTGNDNDTKDGNHHNDNDTTIKTTTPSITSYLHEYDDKNNYSQIMKDMWKCTRMFHQSPPPQEEERSSSLSSSSKRMLLMRHQTLEGSNTITKSQGGGYKHVETRINRKDGTIVGIPTPYYSNKRNEKFDNHHHHNNNNNSNELESPSTWLSFKLFQSGILDSYQLLTKIGKVVASIGISSSLICLSGYNTTNHDDKDDVLVVDKNKSNNNTEKTDGDGIDLDMDIRKVQEMVNIFCDDGTDIGFRNETDESCSVHRLCQYGTGTTNDGDGASPGGNNNINNTRRIENLKSHTDWTVVTLVPVSTIVGLEIWNSYRNCWISPERIAKQHYNKNNKLNKNIQCKYEEDCDWNSNYVIVMAGKWLELLTNGNIESTIHRVVTSQQPQPSPLATTRTPQGKQLPGNKQQAAPQGGGGRLSAPFFLRPRQRIPMDLQKLYGVNATTTMHHADTGDDHYIQVLHDFLIKSCNG